jgi:two-component system, OmpR family, response regulator ResD
MDKKIKILIVDDDESVKSMYSEIFKREGFEVEEAADGLDGLDKAVKNPPSVIFTGIIMPRMDGFGLKQELAKNVVTADIPVVMNSHMGRREDLERANELGMSDFIVLGMNTPRQVVDRIKALFEREEYDVQIDPKELDAHKIARDLNFNPQFECPKCGRPMVLHMQLVDVPAKEFRAIFSCTNCG